MNNKELLKKAIASGFSRNKCARVTAGDGREAVQLPHDTEALAKLESAVPTLKSVSNEHFHFWLVRA